MLAGHGSPIGILLDPSSDGSRVFWFSFTNFERPPMFVGGISDVQPATTNRHVPAGDGDYDTRLSLSIF